MYPFAKMYTSRSPKPIPWGKHPVISSLYGNRNTSILFPKWRNPLIYWAFLDRRQTVSTCGDTSDLLAQYLLDKGIKTDYVCGTYWGKPDGNGQSHAWLMVDKHIIIDITGDQFSGKSTFLNYDKSVYVGEGDDFHRLFEVEDRDVHEHRGLSALGGFCGPRLWDLYRKILKYI